MRSFTPVSEARDPRRSRTIIRLIAAERFLRGIVLVVAGIYLVTHSGSDLGRVADRAMRALELDPRRHFLHKLIVKLHHLHAGTVLITGIAAIGYGVLETVEGAGLWLDQLWAEYFTVIATTPLPPPSATRPPRSRREMRRFATDGESRSATCITARE